MKGIVLEGITGSGKTTLLRALLAEWAGTHRGPLWVATEHLTERVLEPLSAADSMQALSHLDSHVSHLDQLAAWDVEAPRGVKTETLFVLERFHFSVACHLPELADHDWTSLEDRLAAHGTLLVRCRLHPGMILERAVRQTRRERPPTWTRWLDTLGRDEEEQATHFRREQESLERLVARTRLPVIEILLSDDPAVGTTIPSAVRMIGERLEAI